MTRITKILSLSAFLALAWTATSPSRACSVCGCGDPLQSVSDVAPMAGSFRLGLEGEYLTAKAAGDDPDRTESLVQKSFTAMLAYSPAKSLSLILYVPMVGKDGKAEGGIDPVETSSNFGLGDLNVGARFFLLQSNDFKTMERVSFAVTAGSYLPTGNNNIEDDGTRIDEHDQLGTGSWAPYGGLFGSIGGEKWDVTANLTSVFHTVNSYDYRYGEALRWGLQGKFKPSEEFALSLSLDGHIAAADQEGGVAVDNTGGTVLEATPGVWWSPAKSWGLYAKAQIPLLTDFLGTQEIGATVQVGTQFFFNP